MQKPPLPAFRCLVPVAAVLVVCAIAACGPLLGPIPATGLPQSPGLISLAAAPSAEPTATVYVRRDENSGKIVYVGPWKQSASSSFSGGTARATATKDALMAATFKGSAVRWVGSVGSGLGKAAVYLDGRLVATVDQSAAKYAAKRAVWSSGALSYGSHRLEIRVLAQAGKRGTGREVMIDAPRRQRLAHSARGPRGVSACRRDRRTCDPVWHLVEGRGCVGIGRVVPVVPRLAVPATSSPSRAQRWR